MPETRLQSDMVQNIGRSAAAAMFQRNQMLANQEEWFDYVQARDGGAFQPSSGGGYLHEEYLPGQQAEYARGQREYHSDQRRSVIQYQKFQQQRFLEAQEFQNKIALENHKSQLAQQEAEQEQKQILQEIEQWKNNPEVDEYTREWNMNQLYGRLWEIDAAPNQPKTYDIDTGVKTRDGQPIFDRWQLTPEGKAEKIVDGVDNYNKRVSEDRQQDDLDEKKNHNAWLRRNGDRKADQDDRKLDQADKQTSRERQKDRWNRRNEQRGEQREKAQHDEDQNFARLMREHKKNWVNQQFDAEFGNANLPPEEEARERVKIESQYTAPSSSDPDYLDMKNQARDEAWYQGDDPNTVPRGDIDERQRRADSLEHEPEEMDEFYDPNYRVENQPEQEMIAQTDVMEDVSGNPLDMDQGMFELPA